MKEDALRIRTGEIAEAAISQVETDIFVPSDKIVGIHLIQIWELLPSAYARNPLRELQLSLLSPPAVACGTPLAAAGITGMRRRGLPAVHRGPDGERNDEKDRAQRQADLPTSPAHSRPPHVLQSEAR